jgi:hypothetical protein
VKTEETRLPTLLLMLEGGHAIVYQHRIEVYKKDEEFVVSVKGQADMTMHTPNAALAIIHYLACVDEFLTKRRQEQADAHSHSHSRHRI